MKIYENNNSVEIQSYIEAIKAYYRNQIGNNLNYFLSINI